MANEPDISRAGIAETMATHAQTPGVHLKRCDRHRRLAVPLAPRLALGRDLRSQMSITAQVTLSVETPFVRIGRSPLQLGHQIAAKIRPLHPDAAGAKAAVDQYYVHAEQPHTRADVA